VSSTLRLADTADLRAIGHLHYRCRIHAYQGIVPDSALAAVSAEMTAAWWTERWRYERETHRLTVAERDGALTGFTYIGPQENDDPELGELYAIHVDPAYQRQGTGRALMTDALGHFRTWGKSRGVLWVLTANVRARGFYEQGGWAPDGPKRTAAIGPAMTWQLRYSRAVESTPRS